MMKTQALSITSIITFFFLRVTAQDNWFPLNINESTVKVEFDMTAWLSRPAGKHGCVLIDGDRFVFEDGTPVKFWGTNIAGERPFMPATEAEAWSKWLARYGFNAVRFHKFTWDEKPGRPSAPKGKNWFWMELK